VGEGFTCPLVHVEDPATVMVPVPVWFSCIGRLAVDA